MDADTRLTPYELIPVLRVSGNAVDSPTEPVKASSLRCLDGREEQLWLGSSDGIVRTYCLERMSDGSSGYVRSDEKRLSASTQGKAPSAIERLFVLPNINKALILTGGALTFHSLLQGGKRISSALERPKEIKGVLGLVLDDGGKSPAGRASEQGSGQSSINICVIRRRVIIWQRIAPSGVETLREIPLPSDMGIIHYAVLRGSTLAVADSVGMYSLIDLSSASMIPLVSFTQDHEQTPSPIATRQDAPDPMASVDGSAQESISSKPSSSSGPAFNLTPSHRPAIASIGSDEFLLATHNGKTSLGLFVRESGEPCRGTIEWTSNVKSLVVDRAHVLALLRNDTVEVHSLTSQELLQRIACTEDLLPRSLRLLGRASSACSITVPRRSDASPELSKVAIALTSGAISSAMNTPASKATTTVSIAPAHPNVLVLGKTAIAALSVPSMLSQADALFAKHAIDQVVHLLGQSNVDRLASRDEQNYIRARAGLACLAFGDRERALLLLKKANLDPRLYFFLAPAVTATLLTLDDEAVTFAGLQPLWLEVRRALAATSVEDSRSANEDFLLSLLRSWRADRRQRARSPGLRIDVTVDTALAIILIDHSKETELFELLQHPLQDVDIGHLAAHLRARDRQNLMVDVYDRLGPAYADILLQCLKDLIDSAVTDAQSRAEYFTRVEALLTAVTDKELLLSSGIWLMRHSRPSGVSLLTAPPNDIILDSAVVFRELKQLDGDIADAYLESTILADQQHDRHLHAELVQRYLDRLNTMMSETLCIERFAALSNGYAAYSGDYASYLCSCFKPSQGDQALGLRLKLMLFLHASSSYDAHAMLDRLANSSLSFEATIVASKLDGVPHQDVLHRLLIDLRDSQSALLYCKLGLVLSGTACDAIASKLGIVIPGGAKIKSEQHLTTEEQRARSQAALQIASSSPSGASVLADILDKTTHLFSPRLEAPEVAPKDMPLSSFRSVIRRSLREVLHTRIECDILKHLQTAHNLRVSLEVWEMQKQIGGTLAESSLPSDDEQADRQAADSIALEEKLLQLVKAKEQ
ncbi:uncharacterized protein L969DRAFT_627351 [Mixia osmundae IAM 14324]|uniref:CNH domain-containing protein n=1 Tax=Mixia osmundae (strain CBS 9802 / IAM 14324 / JCM 22182 / KY 12970) TaxID=764103 RepID=G7EAA2_MIXOS|nr:uncharacterized protein L969DRAFT_627351 [Mixia osmundae IAM 14324]KEI37821.1 hypothetical protein L969DRAFT_627351 [Mixia osmundae IAM 14324]GAA99762.1 hypothetical protein E5Q_06465 [Mixia osmundae IAM 14324]